MKTKTKEKRSTIKEKCDVPILLVPKKDRT